MNRLTSLAVLRRSAAAAAAAATSLSQTRSLQQTCSYNSSSNSRRLGLANHYSIPRNGGAGGLAGTMLFSVAAAASSLIQEAHAKEPRQTLFEDVVLYQYEACPFCNKVKAFLDYYNIPYKVVEVNPISKKEIKWSDYKKVPIVTVEGEQLVNSSDIIDTLFKKLHPDASADSSISTEEEKKWLGWVDSHLVHVLSPNIYRTAGEALESFNYIATHGNFGFMERLMAKYAGATAMYFVAKKLKKKYDITDERASLYQAAETWVDALKDRPFLGGSKPNLADLAVFGVLRPIRNLQSGRDMVENTRIGDWYSRMEKMVGESCRVTA